MTTYQCVLNIHKDLYRIGSLWDVRGSEVAVSEVRCDVPKSPKHALRVGFSSGKDLAEAKGKPDKTYASRGVYIIFDVFI